MNDDGVTATIGAGVNLREATTFLSKNGRALRTTPAYGNITIAGALGTGSHGSTIRYNASLSSQVVGVRIVDGNGNIQNICDPEDLKAFRIHLGLLGIIVKVTVYTVPLYKTLAHNYLINEEILTNGKAIEMAKNADQLALYWFPEFNEVIVANWTIVDVNTPGTAYTYDHVPSIYEVTAFGVASNFFFKLKIIFKLNEHKTFSPVAKEAAFSLTSSTCALANSVGTNEYYLSIAFLINFIILILC